MQVEPIVNISRNTLIHTMYNSVFTFKVYTHFYLNLNEMIPKFSIKIVCARICRHWYASHDLYSFP